MINWIITHALRLRGIALIAVLLLFAAGLWAFKSVPVDAFPDTSPAMVPVFAEVDGLAPEEVERLIAFPVENAMNGLPGVTQIKSTSAFGMAVIYVYFEDGTDIYFARQLVAERLAAAQADLPPMDTPPALGPISTGLGQIFIYYLTMEEGADTGGVDPLLYLRDLNDWVVARRLQTVKGVTDVLSIGGHVTQFQILLDPYKMLAEQVTMDEVSEAVSSGNRNVGGQYLVLGGEESLVRGIGLVSSAEELAGMVVKSHDGRPVHVRDVATVELGGAPRRGVVMRNGGNEVVSGIALKLYGANASEVIEGLYGELNKVREALPEGVSLEAYYEQRELVHNATGTVTNALLWGIGLVTLTLLLFLGSLRAAVIVALAMPFCAAVAALAMKLCGVSANLMSLSGIAIGLGVLVDGSIIIVENISRWLAEKEHVHGERTDLIRGAAKEVARPITFAIIMVVVVFLPIFTLTGVEGKMFRPMAFTVTMALLGSIIAAVVMAPVLCALLLKKPRRNEGPLMRFIKRIYAALLSGALRLRYVMIALTLVAAGWSVNTLRNMGAEFIPTLEEGSIMATVTMAPSISLDEAIETIGRIETRLMKFQPVDEIISRVGRPEAGSHPHPIHYAEVHVELKPQEEWDGFANKNAIVEAMRAELEQYPDINLNFTQPIQNAFDELLSGVKAQLAIKVFGEDLTTIRKTAEAIKVQLEGVEGLVDLQVEQSFGQPQWQVIIDREKAGRYGIPDIEILEAVETAVGGSVISSLYKDTRRYDVLLRYAPEYRVDQHDLAELLIPAVDGAMVSLDQVAHLERAEGPAQINREDNQRRWIVQGNIGDGHALSEVVAAVQERINSTIELPTGVFVEYGGQFENQQRAQKTLLIIVPIVMLSVIGLLWITFGRFGQAFMVFLSAPMAIIGGCVGLMLTGQYLSVPASVGFIALFGIAMQDAVVMITDFNALRDKGRSLREAIIEGSLLRFRPVIMTTVTTLLGLLPLLLSHGAGAEVSRPLAATVIFGLASSTLLTLFVLPCLYSFSRNR